MRMFQKIFLIVAMSAFMLSGCGKSIEKQVAKQLELGNRYLAELDYEQAIVAFSKVIEIDPKSVEAYLGLCEAYMETGNFDEAVVQLELGYEQTKDERILQKLQEYRISLSEEDLKMFQDLYRMMEDEDYASAMNYLGEHLQEIGNIFVNQMSEKLYLFDGIHMESNLNKKGMVLYVESNDYGYIHYRLFFGDFINGSLNGSAFGVCVSCEGGEILDEEYFTGVWKNGILNGPWYSEEKYDSHIAIWQGEFVEDVLTGEWIWRTWWDNEKEHVYRYKIKEGHIIEEGLVRFEGDEQYSAPCELCESSWLSTDLDHPIHPNPWPKDLLGE